MILIKEGAKPFQQKLRNIYPTLEPLTHKELRKFLDAQIIERVRHLMWVSNLVPVSKKSREIRLGVDFWNLNRTLDKDNYTMPSMEKILQIVFGSRMFSLLDGYSSYNQVLITDPIKLKTTFRMKWVTFIF